MQPAAAPAIVAGLAGSPHADGRADDRTDYVISAAVGWATDDDDVRAPSRPASFAPAGDPTRILPEEGA